MGPLLAIHDHGVVRSVAVPVNRSTVLSFSYQGTKTASDHWPPDNPTDYQRLKAISLLKREGAERVVTLAFARLWIEGEPVKAPRGPVDMNASFTPSAPPARASSPQIFVRTITTPSGLPWDQQRAAELDARMGAPAPIADLQYRLVRLEPWSFGRSGRFGALYIRARDLTEGFEAEALIDGRHVKAIFGSPEARRREARTRLYRILAALGGTALLAGAVISAFSARTDRQDRLEALKQKSQIIARVTSNSVREKAQARLVEGSDARRLADAVKDLDWAANAKSPLAHLQSVHWEREMMTVTTRGDTPPFAAADREVRRANAPVGPALWLWGVGPRPKDQAGGSR